MQRSVEHKHFIQDLEKKITRQPNQMFSVISRHCFSALPVALPAPSHCILKAQGPEAHQHHLNYFSLFPLKITGGNLNPGLPSHSPRKLESHPLTHTSAKCHAKLYCLQDG